MPVLNPNNHGGTIRDNTQIRQPGESGLIQPQEEEQRIADAVLQDRLELKNTPLSRMTGLKSTVIYYQQKTIGRNDYLVNTAGVNTIDVNKLNFIEIKDFVILCQGETSYQSSPTEMSIDVNVDGEAKVLPKTIQPLAGDRFIMSVGDKNCLFKVTGVSKTTIETDAAYAFTYTLEEDILGEKYSEIKKCVTETRHFLYAHVGTSFRTIFREDEYIAIEKLSKLYNTLSELYNEMFYNKDKNTYILRFDSLDIKDESGTPLEESRIEHNPMIVGPADGEKYDPRVHGLGDKPTLNNSDTWFGSLMYDRMLIEFVTKTKIFNRVKKRIFKVSQLQQDLEHWYNKTVFYALEHQTTKLLKYKTFIPAPITRVTIASNLNLFGTVSLEPSAQSMENTLGLYPTKLIPDMLWGDEFKSDTDINLNTYNDMIDLICETLGLYTRKKEDCIMSRLLLMYDNFEDFYELSIKDQNTFYLFPMLGYVICKMMDMLSDPNFGLQVMPSSVASPESDNNH